MLMLLKRKPGYAQVKTMSCIPDRKYDEHSRCHKLRPLSKVKEKPAKSICWV